MSKKGVIVLTIVLLMLSTPVISVLAEGDDLSVEKNVEPTDIMLAGTGPSDTTTVTISVTGYGGTVEDTLPLDVVFAASRRKFSGSFQSMLPELSMAKTTSKGNVSSTVPP